MCESKPDYKSFELEFNVDSDWIIKEFHLLLKKTSYNAELYNDIMTIK